MTPKHIIFWILLVLFVGGSLFWFAHVPYRPLDLYRVVPAQTVFMSHHEQLADRWESFRANPLAQTLLTSAGLDLDDLAEWSDDPNTRMWLDKLLERDVVLAHVPSLGPGRQPAWVVTGWIGAESIRLRWLLTRGRLDGFQKIKRHAGGSYWLVETDPDQNEQLSLAVVEGMLVAAFSPDPHAVRYLLDVYDGLAPAHPLTPSQRGAVLPPWTDGALDRGWFTMTDAYGITGRYFFDVTQMDGRGLNGSIFVDDAGRWPTMPAADIETPSRFFGGIPFLVLGAHPEAAYAALIRRLPFPAQIIVQGLYETEWSSPVLLAINGGDYAGSWAGISVPSIMTAWPISGGDDPRAQVQLLLDRLNAAFQWGLVMTETRMGDWPVYVIEGTGDSVYSRLRFRERAAFAVIDGWFIGSTHSFPLMQLIGRYDRPEALFDADQGGWQGSVRQGQSVAYGYTDIRGGARTLRLALSAYSVKLLFDDPQSSRETRQRINEARAWIDTLEPMGAAHAWIEQDDEILRLRLLLGETGE